MITLKHKDLLDAGVHFGHMTSKWHPNMAPFIFMERKGIHIIDLNKTLLQLQEASHSLEALARAGQRILFVATKKQAKAVVEQEAKRLRMPYVTARWLGGTLTNFATIRRLIKKMSSFEKMMKETAYQNMAKKEQLMIAREKAKLERLLQGLADTTRLPAALVVVDIKREHIAVKEAQRLGIPVFALTDTNSDPSCVDYPIPSNDDASRSIEILVKALGSAIEDGLAARKKLQETSPVKQEKAAPRRVRNVEKVTFEKEAAKLQAPLSRPTKATKPKATAQGSSAKPAAAKEATKPKATAQESSAKPAAAKEATKPKATAQGSSAKPAAAKEATKPKATAQESSAKPAAAKEATKPKATAQESSAKKAATKETAEPTKKAPAKQAAKPTASDKAGKAATKTTVKAKASAQKKSDAKATEPAKKKA